MANTYVAAVKAFLGSAHTVGFTPFNARALIKLKRAPRKLRCCSCAIHWLHSRVSAPIPPPQQLWSTSLALSSSVWCPVPDPLLSIDEPSLFWWPWASASPCKKSKDGKCRHRQRDLAAQHTDLLSLLAVRHRSILVLLSSLRFSPAAARRRL